MLQTVQGRKQIELPFPNRPCLCSSASAALATVLRFRLQQLNVETPAPGEATPLTDALLADEEPATGPEGTLSWAVDVKDPGAGDDFTVFVKEAQTRFGRLPFAVRIAGRYPEELDGLCELLSMDMRIIDVAWIGMKLAALVDYAEPLGRFIARVPGAEQSEMQPSVVAYIAKLLLFRYRMLGLLTAEAKPVHPIGVMVEVEGDTQNVVSFNARAA
jgi:ribonucleoside-diphosphate reductase alpha chain